MTAAISAVELVITVAVIGFVATISIMAVNAVTGGTQGQKTETDVKTLNAAITMYLANGGNLDEVTTADQLLNKLKSSRSKSDKRRHVGAPSGKMIDPRVSIRLIAENSKQPGAIFNSNSKRFEVVSIGKRFEFILDDELNEFSSGIEDRDHSLVAYSKNSSWVWDHAALSNPNLPSGPTTATTGNSPGDSVPSTDAGGGDDDGGDDGDDDDDGNGGSNDDPPAPLPPRLPTPQFDLSPGGHPDSDFPLSVSITNMPASETSTVVYKTNGGSWQVYGGAIEVPMNTTVSAQFLSTDTSLYRDSSTRSGLYYPVPTSLNGTVDGAFGIPTGGPNLVYNLSNGNKTLSHGDPIYLLDGVEVNTGDPNVLQFTPGTISNVAPGQKFTLGTLFYHNGSSYYDSHATAGKLTILITFPDLNESVGLDLNMDMVNTANDPDDLAASADYVKILNLTQNIPLSINGVAYQIRLEFGATDSFGFSSASQFHVYEGATGQGQILGTFLAAP